VPKWVSEKGYWVLKSNRNTPTEHIVRFYDNEGKLMHSSNIYGARLNPSKRRVKMKLKNLLEAIAGSKGPGREESIATMISKL